ncbi:MAG TPA: hypothetical protein VJP86_12520, partial [Vicinamibacterales bacterium]|nr:hypothetical protein [Vicinamibacterales bacterium]
MKFRKPWAVLAAIVVSAIASRAEAQPMPNAPRGCAELFGLPGLVWRGPGSKMAMQDLAAYAAPVFWLSPDEPTVHGQHGRDLRVPAAFPFESTATSPVIYYQVTLVADLPNAGASGFQLDPQDKGRSVLDLEKVSALRILYIAYFPEESGVGQHLHDVE